MFAFLPNRADLGVGIRKNTDHWLVQAKIRRSAAPARTENGTAVLVSACVVKTALSLLINLIALDAAAGTAGLPAQFLFDLEL